MEDLKGNFISLINKHMQPWSTGTIPVKLNTAELLTFAGEYFPTTIEVVDGDTTIIHTLAFSDINIIMESLGFERKVAHCAFEGLSVSWLVTLKQSSGYEFK